MVSADFTQAVADARQNLLFDSDPIIAQAAQESKILTAEAPSADMLQAAGVKPTESLLGVYYCCPKSIVLYENSIGWGAGLLNRTQAVLRHELEHWVGYNHTKGFLTCAACIQPLRGELWTRPTTR